MSEVFRAKNYSGKTIADAMLIAHQNNRIVWLEEMEREYKQSVAMRFRQLEISQKQREN